MVGNNEKQRMKLLKDEEKVEKHYKMFKTTKGWFFVAISLIIFGAGMTVESPSVQANDVAPSSQSSQDTTNKNTSVVTSNTASTVQRSASENSVSSDKETNSVSLSAAETSARHNSTSQSVSSSNTASSSGAVDSSSTTEKQSDNETSDELKDDSTTTNLGSAAGTVNNINDKSQVDSNSDEEQGSNAISTKKVVQKKAAVLSKAETTKNVANNSSYSLSLNGETDSADLNLQNIDNDGEEQEIVISGSMTAGDQVVLKLPYGMKLEGADTSEDFTMTSSGSANDINNPVQLSYEISKTNSIGIHVYFIAANDYLQIADQTKSAITLTSGETLLATVPVTFTNSTTYTTTQEITRVQPKVSDVSTVTTGEEYGYQVRFSAGTYDVNGDESDDTYRTQLTNIVVTIPVPTGFKLDAATSTLIQANGTTTDTKNQATYTQPDGVGGDVIVTYPAKLQKSDVSIRIMGSYVLGTPTGTVSATNVPVLTGTLLGKNLTVTASKVITDNLVEPDYKTSFEILPSNSGSSLLLDAKKYANQDSNRANDSDNNLLFITNLKNLSNYTTSVDTLITIPDGLYVTNMKAPVSGDDTDSYPTGTTFTVTATAWDGTIETKVIALGDTFIPSFSDTQGVKSFEIVTSKLGPGVGYTGTYRSSNNTTGNFRFYGYVLDSYQDGTKILDGQKLIVKETDQDNKSQDSLTITATTMPVSVVGPGTSYKTDSNVLNAGDTITATYAITSKGDSYYGPENLALPYEPIVYIVAPQGTSFAGDGDLTKALTFLNDDFSKATITQLKDTADGRQIIEIDWSGTGISPTINKTLQGNFVVNSDVLPGSKITVSQTNDAGTLFITAQGNLTNYNYHDYDYAIDVTDDASSLFGDDVTIENDQLWMEHTEDSWLITSPTIFTVQNGLKNIDESSYNIYNSADPAGTSATFYLGGQTEGNYRLFLYNGTTNPLATVQEYVALPSIFNGDAYGANLTGPVTTEADDVTVLYSTEYANADGQLVDTSNFVPASAISDWSTVKSFVICTTNLLSNKELVLNAPMKVVDLTTDSIGKVALTKTQTVAASSSGTAVVNIQSIGSIIEKGQGNVVTETKATKVTFKFVDENGNTIKSDQVLNGYVGNDYKMTPPEITGYVYNSSDKPLSGEMVSGGDAQITITLNYIKGQVQIPAETPAKVTFKFVDKNENTIKLDQVLNGYVGNAYDMTAPNIAGYTFVSSDEPLSGTITGGNTITLVYKSGTVATETPAKVTFKFVDENGNTIKSDQVLNGYVGNTYNLTAPTIAGYTFASSDEPLSGKITGDNTITLVYKHGEVTTETPAKVTFKFVDENGNTIKSDQVLNGYVGNAYDLKAPDIAGYTFASSDEPLSGTITGDNTITLVYKSETVATETPAKVTFKFVDENGNTIKSDQVLNGYLGNDYDLTVPDIDGYAFASSDEPLNGKITGDETITLVYKSGTVPTETPAKVTFKFVDENGNTIKSDQVLNGYVGNAYDLTAPTIAGYAFASSDEPLRGKITGDNTITLVYKHGEVAEETPAKVTFKFVDENGNTIKSDQVLNGYVGNAYDLTVPTIAGYAFASSDEPLNGKITGDETITLVYKSGTVVTETPAKVTFKFVDENGNTINADQVLNGYVGNTYDLTAPTISGYTFLNADGLLSGTITGNATITLIYKSKTTLPNGGGNGGDGTGTTPGKTPDNSGDNGSTNTVSGQKSTGSVEKTDFSTNATAQPQTRAALAQTKIQAKRLPQTGEHQANLVTLLGLNLMGVLMALLGIDRLEKKYKHEGE